MSVMVLPKLVSQDALMLPYGCIPKLGLEDRAYASMPNHIESYFLAT